MFRLLLLFAIVAFPAWGQQQRPDIVEVIEISGDIGPGTAVMLAKQIEQVNDNPKVRAVMLEVETPGGGAIASAAVYEELAKIKVPVVGWCNSVCASGGMYALMSPSVKFITVRSEAITGSIGVIMQMTRYNRLLEWAKIDAETYKSGVLKDVGNPTRPGFEAEKAHLQSIVDGLAQRFYAVVDGARGAKITPAGWEAIKSARLFIGSDAVKVGLADAVMTRDQAIAKAKELSGAKLIFTRDEIRKMSAQAEAPPIRYRSALPTLDEKLLNMLSIVEEIHAGEAIRIQYRMPYQF